MKNAYHSYRDTCNLIMSGDENFEMKTIHTNLIDDIKQDS